MKTLKEIILPHLIKPKVIHRLPGRLRIHVPAIRYIQQEHNHIADQLVEKIRFSHGIESVEISIISGNLLIHYRTESTNETEVMEWMYKLYDLILAIRKRISEYPDEERANTAGQLLDYLKRVKPNGIDLCKQGALLEDIWA
ncbi:MAG: hypothetical protein V2J62_08675 [candidate division KSB1 bacterium]|nr:hypothetical protein [candidate division KSB1 bacterium]